VNNCRDAMKLAKQHFGIPLILRPEDLASSELDELSAITYLSYFTKVGAPGYTATLHRIQQLLRINTVFNFTTDWNDGQVLLELVKNLGGDIDSWHDTKGTNIERIQCAIDGAKSIGVQPLLTAADIAAESTEHLGIMAQAARFIYFKPIAPAYTIEYNSSKQILTTNESASTTTLMSHSSHQSIDVSEQVNNSRQMTYNLVRTPSIRRAKKVQHHEEPNITELDDIKKDTYSVGVIMYTTSHTLVDPEEVRVEAVSPTGRLIKMNGDGVYHAKFSPREVGIWKVSMFINNRLVDSCPVEVSDPSQVKVSEIKGGTIVHQHQFQIDCSKAGPGKPEVEITHKGHSVPCYVRETRGRTNLFTAHYTPISAGLYKIILLFNKAEIRHDILTEESIQNLNRQAVFNTIITTEQDHYKIKASCDWQVDYMTGGPYEVYIGDSADIRVYSMQDGTVCNFPHLIADCSKAPGGQIEAEVSYNGYKFPAKIVEDSTGVYKILFTPRGPGTYKIWITFDGQMIKGSPFMQEIAELTSPLADGPGLKRGSVGKPATFTIDARGFPGSLSVDVQGPHYPLNATITEETDKSHSVTYIPEEVGIHRVHIKLNGKDITGSPYHPKIVDPDAIQLPSDWTKYPEDQRKIPLYVGHEKHIPFDATQAGPGELTANIRGPGEKVPVTVDSSGDGKHTLIFVPKEEGKHFIEVMWSGFPLRNSPYLGIAVDGPPPHEPRVEPILQMRALSPTRKTQSPVSIVTEGAPYVRINGGPYNTFRDDNHLRPDHVQNGPNRVYRLSPTPKETDLHVAYNYPTYTEPHRIHIYRHGSNASSLPSSKRDHIPRNGGSVYSYTNSNPDPENTIVRLQRTSPTERFETSPTSSLPPSRGSSYKYVPPLQNSPPISQNGPSPKVILKGKGLREATVNKPAIFHIDGRNAGPGAPEADCRSLKNVIPVDIEPTGPKQYKCTYVPPTPGAYLLDVKWDNRPLKVCPFKINVHNPVYPNRVTVSPDDINQGGEVGKNFHIKIDPREAGHGKLTVKCTGPHGQNVPAELHENFDGTFRVTTRPTDRGVHILEVKLNGEHVKGSPYTITMRDREYGPLRVYGPGLQNGLLADYQGYFWADASEAGPGELHVSIMGPKGGIPKGTKVFPLKTKQLEWIKGAYVDKRRQCHCLCDQTMSGIKL
ncbi:hypothetical protein ACJMK2_017952, partial [Sinanodonta woodiana]